MWAWSHALLASPAVRRWAIGLLLAPLLLGAAVATAGAASLSSSDPTSGAALESVPDRVRLVFPAPVEEAFLVLEVVGSGGASVGGPPVIEPGNPAAVVVALDPVPDGEYAVRYGALTEDGNVLGDAYSFTVGGTAPVAAASAPAPVRGPPQAVLLLGQFLILIGPVVLLGALAIRWLALEPAWREGGVAPPGPVEERASAAERMRGAAGDAARPWWRLAWFGLGAWLIGVPVAVAGYLVALQEPLGESGTLLSDTRAGSGLIALGVAWVIAAIGLLALSWGIGSGLDVGRALAAVPALAAAAALFVASWSGHASSGNDRIVGIGADALHNWGAALWLGGLAALALWLPRARRRLAPADRTALSAGAVVRFSTIAIVAVTVLVVTGVYRALAELPSLADLVESAWGLALLVKLILFGVLLGLGAYNRVVLHPRLERAALGLSDSERGAARTLFRTTGTEIALGAAVMVAAAFLVVLAVPAG